MMNVEVRGNLGAAKAINTILGVNVNGSLGTATTGGLLMNVFVDGYAGALTADRTMINVDVMRDADLVSSGGLMSNVSIRGDVDSLEASFMTSVGVSGDVHTLEADYLLVLSSVATSVMSRFASTHWEAMIWSREPRTHTCASLVTTVSGSRWTVFSSPPPSWVSWTRTTTSSNRNQSQSCGLGHTTGGLMERLPKAFSSRE